MQLDDDDDDDDMNVNNLMSACAVCILIPLFTCLHHVNLLFFFLEGLHCVQLNCFGDLVVTWQPLSPADFIG